MIAAGVTLLVHAIIAVLLWLTYFGAPAEQDESGILVMVGVDATGNGNELLASNETDLQPEPSPVETPPAPTQSASEPAPAIKPTPDPVLTQDDAEAPFAAADEEKKLKQKQEEEARLKAEAEARRQEELRKAAEEEARRKAEEEARRKAEEDAKRKAINNLVAGALNNNGTGGNAGLQGSPNGNSNTGATQGSAGYGDYDLGGRGLLGSLPRPNFNSNITGKIVVNITVNAAGKVTYADIKPGNGTTVPDRNLQNAAKEAAMKARFERVQGTSLTPGRITYYFDSNN